MKNTQEELTAVRAELDGVDQRLLELLKQRSELVKKVTDIKVRYGLSAHQPERFTKMLDNLLEKAKSIDLDPVLVETIWNAIHESSMNQQNQALLSVEPNNNRDSKS